MIDLEFLQSLIKAMDESGLDSIEIERGGTRVRLSKSPTGTVVAPAAPAAGSSPPGGAPATGAGGTGAAAAGPEAAVGETPDAGGHLLEIESPMVGTFYRAPAPDAPPYVEVGDRISKGDTLCIIEAMKLMNELEAEVSGTVTEVCIENAEPVEYGQVLFRVEPS